MHFQASNASANDKVPIEKKLVREESVDTKPKTYVRKKDSAGGKVNAPLIRNVTEDVYLKTTRDSKVTKAPLDSKVIKPPKSFLTQSPASHFKLTIKPGKQLKDRESAFSSNLPSGKLGKSKTSVDLRKKR